MSLVAYGSSDEESGSEQGDIEAEPITKPAPVIDEKTTDPPISDEEDDFGATKETAVSGLSLPAPQHDKPQQSESVGKQPASTSKNSFLSALPKPKAEAVAGTEEEGEIEDFIKKNTEQLKASVQIEAKPKSQKRKIIITAPELINSDSDEEQPQAKKTLPAPSTGKKCGLFAVLPAPKNMSLGAGKETKATTGKMFAGAVSKSKPPTSAMSSDSSKSPLTTVKSSAPFVPASLTRKPNQSSRSAFNLETGMMMSRPLKKVSSSQPESSAYSKIDSKGEKNGSDTGIYNKSTSSGVRLSGVPQDVASSDDEDGDDTGSANFFSLGHSAQSNPLSANSLSVTSSVSTLPSVGNKDSDGTGALTSPSLQDQPLSFKPRDSSMQNAPLQFKAMSGGHSMHKPGPSTSGLYGNAYYNMAGVSEDNEGEGQTDERMEQTSEQYAEPGDSFAQDQEFLKMQGKSKRGKEEINIIDVRQDDQIAEVDINLIKNLSEENANRASHSKKKNEDMPTSQQRRKHQITYLAFKAKEREVELKDQWAANRQTKRQTQSKYGF